jgi:Ser/Thr protein kinase RdoA (MazF antagonist)
LSKDWLRGWIAPAAEAMAQLPTVQNRPLVRRTFPRPAVARLTRLWDEREVFLSALARLPQTFCHRDAFRRNLLLCQSPDRIARPTLIDWEFAGIGAIGEELAALVAASLMFYEVDLAQACALDELTATAYVEGLRAAGWPGDARQVRAGYCTSAALRYGLSPVWIVLPIVADETRYAATEQIFGHTMEEIADHMAACIDLLLERADEARTLLRQLP